MREEHEMEAEADRQRLDAERDVVDDAKEAERLRVLHAAEDSSRWGGVALGQMWFPRDGNRPVYVTDLVQLAQGGKFVTYADAAGKRIGSAVLSLFLTRYQRR